MLLQRYLAQPDIIIRRLSFFYHGGFYSGRGVLSWNPNDGYYLEAPVVRDRPVTGSIGFGGGGTLRERDFGTIRMRDRTSRGWIIAPQVILRDRLDVLIQERVSIPIARIISSEPAHISPSTGNVWSGQALYRLTGNVRFPDQVNQEIRINNQEIGQSTAYSGIFHEQADGQRIIGRIVERQYLEIYYRLPRGTWSRAEAWKFGEAVSDSLSICLGQSVALLKRFLVRNERVYTEMRRQREVQDFRTFAPLNVDDGLRRDLFIHLTNYFARNSSGSEVCRRIYLQMAEAERQRTWHGRSILLSTILEAALRTLEGHAFQPRDRSFRVQEAFERFRIQYLPNGWQSAFERAYHTYERLRHRNAHPDWLFDETGVLSDEHLGATYNDLRFLSRFYGYMILAISGLRDLDPPAEVST